MKFKHPLDPTPPATMAELLARLKAAMDKQGYIEVFVRVYGLLDQEMQTEYYAYISLQGNDDEHHRSETITGLWTKIIGAWIIGKREDDGIKNADLLAKAGGAA